MVQYNTYNTLNGQTLPHSFAWSNCEILHADFEVILEPNSTAEYLAIKQCHRNVLLSSFHLNDRTLGFHSQTQKIEPPCTA